MYCYLVTKLCHLSFAECNNNVLIKFISSIFREGMVNSIIVGMLLVILNNFKKHLNFNFQRNCWFI